MKKPQMSDSARWDTVFKVGTHTDSNGNTRSWTQEEMEQLAKSEDTPIVIVHPGNEEEAVKFGATDQLRVVDGKLQALYKDVPDALRAAVTQGLRLAKSVSIDPATMRLNHIGLLGADQPPAVDGLGAVTFTKKPEEAIHYNFIKEEPETMDPKDKQITDLQKKIADLTAQGKTDEIQAKLNKAETDLQAEKTAHEATKKEFSKYKTEQADAGLVARVDALAESGRILPAEKEKVMAFAKALGDGEATMDFAKSDGSTEKVSTREAYLRDMEKREADTSLTSEFAKNGDPGGQDEEFDISDINKYA